MLAFFEFPGWLLTFSQTLICTISSYGLAVWMPLSISPDICSEYAVLGDKMQHTWWHFLKPRSDKNAPQHVNNPIVIFICQGTGSSALELKMMKFESNHVVMWNWNKKYNCYETANIILMNESCSFYYDVIHMIPVSPNGPKVTRSDSCLTNLEFIFWFLFRFVF